MTTDMVQITVHTKHHRHFGDLVEYRADEHITVMSHELQRDVDIDMRDILSIHFEQELVCTSDDPNNHQGDTCPIHEGAN